MAFRPASAGGVGLSSSPRRLTVGNGFASGNAASGFYAASPVIPSKHEAAAAARREAELGDELSRNGQFREALARYTAALRLLPGQPDYHYKLACVAWSAAEFDRVEPHLLEAARLDPGIPAVQEALALWYLRQDRIVPALKHSAAAVSLQPDNAEYLITRADVMASDGEYEAAWRLIAPLLCTGVRGPWLARIYAKVAPKIGHETQAVAFIERSLQSSGLSPADRSRLHFASAALLDKMGRFDEAFRQAALANRSCPRPFDTVTHGRSVSELIRYYTPKRIRSLARATHGSRRPVLIVGMPRSGTSLVEQILASHPAVHGGGELSTLSEMSVSAATADWNEGKAFPDCFDLLSMRRANEFAGKYLAKLDSINTTATHVTDKMPLNFLHLGTAEQLFPDCRVIHCVRNARDTCLSCYFTDFAARGQCGFDLAGLAGVYGDYRRLMDHWKDVLTLPILDVQYEDLVSDQEDQTRRLLKFLDLPWDDRCMAFHETPRPVATASRDQVRRPIYTSSIGRWKQYQKHIPELMRV